MPIPLSSSFALQSALPLDSRSERDTIVLRDAIPAAYRTDGLKTYVRETGLWYTLTGGIENTDWLEDVSKAYTDGGDAVHKKNTAIKIADYQVTSLDKTITADGTAEAVTITMPASPVTGQGFTVACLNSDNLVLIDWNGRKIYGSSANFPLKAEESISVEYNGSQYIELS